MAGNYRLGLGFEPHKAAVRSCEEHDNEALARIVFSGRDGSRQRFYKDVLTLRRSGDVWGVVLPARFERGR
jgi:hypothetical protein